MLWRFFVDHIPPWNLILWLVPASLVYAVVVISLSAYAKTNRGWRTGYSRKLFHFFIFTAASIVQSQLGYEGTIVFGSTVSLIIFYAIWRGDEFPWYEAMAREKDAPKRTYYILAPYTATLAGGVSANFFFPPDVALFGYLVAGFGDAIAEPIGVRFGKHHYNVPSLRAVKSQRSLEGSVAVFLGSLMALFAAMVLIQQPVDASVALKLILIAFSTALIEAVSPHGWDNFTLQIGTCLLVHLMVWPTIL